jgi:hypothetical protein
MLWAPTHIRYQCAAIEVCRATAARGCSDFNVYDCPCYEQTGADRFCNCLCLHPLGIDVCRNSLRRTNSAPCFHLWTAICHCIGYLHDIPPSAPTLHTTLPVRLVAGNSALSHHVHDQPDTSQLWQQSSVGRSHSFVHFIHSSFHCCPGSRAAGRNKHEQDGMDRYLHGLRRIGTFDESQHTWPIADQPDCTGVCRIDFRGHSMGSRIGAFTTHGDQGIPTRLRYLARC